MDDGAQTLGAIAGRIVVRLAAKPVDVARRRNRKRADGELNMPSLPDPSIAVRKGRGGECVGLVAKG